MRGWFPGATNEQAYEGKGLRPREESGRIWRDDKRVQVLLSEVVNLMPGLPLGRSAQPCLAGEGSWRSRRLSPGSREDA